MSRGQLDVHASGTATTDQGKLLDTLHQVGRRVVLHGGFFSTTAVALQSIPRLLLSHSVLCLGATLVLQTAERLQSY
jgi:hypothetical protein